jgi:hypothetical protein
MSFSEVSNDLCLWLAGQSFLAQLSISHAQMPWCVDSVMRDRERIKYVHSLPRSGEGPQPEEMKNFFAQTYKFYQTQIIYCAINLTKIHGSGL